MKMGRKRKREFDDEEAVKLYKNGVSSKVIAKQFGTGADVVLRAVKSAGVSVRGRGPKRMEMSVSGEILKKRYGEGESAGKIAKSIGVQHHIVERWLKEGGVELRGSRGNSMGNCDEHFFKEINSERKAYWLGWMLSDGYVSERYVVGLDIQEGDREVLQYMKEDLGVRSGIKIVEKGIVRLSWRNKVMCADLERLGVVMAKSKIAVVPEIEKELWVAFARGLVEGDGGITDQAVFVTGTEKVCRWFERFCVWMVPESAPNVYEDIGCWRCSVYGAVARTVAERLYVGAKRGLSRKWHAAELLCGKGMGCPIACIGISRAQAKEFLEKYHYLGDVPDATVIKGWVKGGGVRGVAVFGSPSSPVVAKTVFGIENDAAVWELRRFAVMQPSEKNEASMFLAMAIREFARERLFVKAIISFADEGAGHIGGVYQAIGARYIGGERKLYARLDDGGRVQLGRGGGEEVVGAKIEAVIRHKYVIFVGRGKARREDEERCLLVGQAYPKMG